MDPLLRLERWLDTSITRVFARLFKSPVDPVEIAAALRRECDHKAARIAGGRTLIPNEFMIELSAMDSKKIEPEKFKRSLTFALDTYASERGYSFAGPISISFSTNNSVETGLFQIRSTALAMAPVFEESDIWLEVGTKKFPLKTGRFRVGRDDQMDLRLEDPGVSRHHCDIERNDQTITLHDLGSTNGTLVNGVAISRAILDDGSVIRVGSTDLVVRVR